MDKSSRLTICRKYNWFLPQLLKYFKSRGFSVKDKAVIPERRHAINVHSDHTVEIETTGDLNFTGYDLIQCFEYKSLKYLSTEPVAKKGDWVEVIDYGASLHGNDYHILKPYKLCRDYTHYNGFFTVFDDNGNLKNGWSMGYWSGIKIQVLHTDYVRIFYERLAGHKNLKHGNLLSYKDDRRNNSSPAPKTVFRPKPEDKYYFDTDKEAMYLGNNLIFDRGIWASQVTNK